MDYISLNKNQRTRMNQITNNKLSMEWQDQSFFDYLIGKLPKIHHYQNEKELEVEINELKKIYSDYDCFSSNKVEFFKKVKNIVKDIRSKNPYWYGLNLYELEECIKQHESCLISGAGGIGKSYFIKCLEEEFERMNIAHLCIYGKFEKDVHNIDLNEINNASEKGFVFIVDAINEMSYNGQNNLLEMIKNIKKNKKIRVILTYRINSIENNILEKYEELLDSNLFFPGVSFESALSELLKISIPNVYKYEDILYSNNALHLSMLCEILSDKKLIAETENSICSVTFILEQYIKKVIQKDSKIIEGINGKQVWIDTKNIAKWMYIQEKKEIDRENLLSIIKTGNKYIDVMLQDGFIQENEYNGKQFFSFTIDSLSDYLISRSVFDDIKDKEFKEQVKIISQKSKNFYNIDETLILVIFDYFAPNYQYIKKLLRESNLMASVDYNLLIKITFNTEYINIFLNEFIPLDKTELISILGGYTDKPFNCVNYLNEYYKDANHQLRELSLVLSKYDVVLNIKRRLKNILYFITISDNNKTAEEAFYFALWCCASPNKEIRCIAVKLLYEITMKINKYKNILIETYIIIKDPYIKESIIYVLANYLNNDKEIFEFFSKLIKNESQLTAKSIKRISLYINKKYDYINWKRDNLYNESKNKNISDFLNEILLIIDFKDKDFMPFRYWGKDNIEMHSEFLSINKSIILEFNQLLEKEFICVKNGECNGSLSFEENIYKEFDINFKDYVLNQISFFDSFEKVIKNIFNLFQESTNKKNPYKYNEDFMNSIFMKCIDIATGIYYGSLMCNYYTNEFATYNNYQESIGYEVYDPLEYDEDININTPIPRYQDFIEKLGDRLINRIYIPQNKDLSWVKDADITRKNLLSILDPIKQKKIEWVILAGRISIQEDNKMSLKWKDTYDIWCCTADEETIIDGQTARYLTIELEDYTENLSEYENYSIKPWLCKNIRSIKYDSGIFDDTNLVLPPAELISFFKLKLDYSDMSWINEEGVKVILCNNNKNSYYTDPIGSTVFIRKDYLEKYLEQHNLKYFAFAEKYIPETGYVDETSLHFEIINGKINKEIMNGGRRYTSKEKVSQECINCTYGFYRNIKEFSDNEFGDFLKMGEQL